MTRERTRDPEKGGTILEIAEELDRHRGYPKPVPGERWIPCGMQPFLREFLGTFGMLIEDEPRQRLLDFLPRALTTHEWHRHGVNNIAEERRSLDAARSVLLVAQKARPSPVMNSIDTGTDTVGTIVKRLYELAKHHDKERVLWSTYETWWGYMHNPLASAHHSAIVFAAVDIEAGMRLLDRAVEPHGYKTE